MSIVEVVRKTTTVVEVAHPGVQGPPGSGGGGAVSSVNGRPGAVVLTSADVGLSNVNNTSDANKPVSTAQAAADTAVATAASNALAAHVAAADPHTGYALESSLAAVATSGAYADLTGKPTLGTAAPLNVAASGDAASGEVVKGSDSRLTDARTPTTHTHTASQISDSTAAGRAVLTAADAAAQRTALGVPAGSGNSTGTNTGDQTNITGNAGTATALQTARNINGVAFDGTANITINAVDSTARVAKAGDTMTGALNWSATQTIASATTTDIGAATSNSVIVSGTTTITALGTIAAGAERVVQFSGALTLTHNATSLILPGGASITTAAGDVAYFVSLGSGNWRCTGYQKANGQAVVASGGTGDFKSDGTVAMTAKIRCPITGTVSAFIGSSGTTSSDVAIWSDLSKFYFLNGNNTGYVPVNTGPLTASGLVTSSGGFIHGSTGGLASNINGGWALLNSVLTAYVNATAAKIFVTGATVTYDTAWERGASGRMDSTDGAGNLRDVRGRSLISSGGVITLSASTVAGLLSATLNPDSIAIVTDASSPVLGSTVVGGGSTRVLVQAIGGNWVVIGGVGATGGSTNTRWLGAGEFIPRVTNGAGIDGQEFSTNRQNLDYLAFDPGTQEFAQASFDWPSGYTTFTATFYWTAASGSGAVVWRAAARCYADGDAIDQAFGTAQSVTDTLITATNNHASSATSAVTPSGTVSAGNLCVVQIDRDATNGSDTLAVDGRLIGVRLVFA